ncbi:hypothetical protein AWB78_05933 [Caballeronia calidae]|uniref:Uncharacterized protein n=1 Tax=Caballeronia calidae TaxID=1777139 RepID=A0A158E0J6_9BURK|nr:hypothetical protein AWB78_05933 [Caballeronia calidae]
MHVVALFSKRPRRGSLRTYVGVVAKPIAIISIGYCILSNISFRSSFDGSLSMSLAAETGLVTETYAQQHATDVVLFKRVGPELFEYRVKRPIVGYAGIPWLVAHRTNIDLTERCEGHHPHGCRLQAE